MGSLHRLRRSVGPAAPRLGKIAAFVALTWGVLAFGAVYPWSYWPLAIACAACGALALLSGCLDDGRGFRPLLWSLGVVAFAILLQLIPLPIATLQALSPNGAAALSQLDLAMGTGLSASHALSLATANTWTGLALYCAMVLLLIGVTACLSAGSPARFVEFLAVLGAVVALIGIVQKPLFGNRIYGVWTPVYGTDPFGPFVNKNHFAGWIVMTLSATLGLLCAQIDKGMRGVKPDWRTRIVWFSSVPANRLLLTAAAAILMALSLMLTLSRSGMFALAVAVGAMGWFVLRGMPGAWRRAIGAVYLVFLAYTVVSAVGRDTLTARFTGATGTPFTGRLPIWSDTLRIVEDFWLTGTGLNTYGTATLLYQTSYRDEHLQEAHNDYLQLAAEGGLLLGIPIVCSIVLFAVAVRRRFRESTSGSTYWIRAGAVTGIVAMACQSAFDFSLQMPGNATLFVVLCGIALHSAGDGHGRQSPRIQ